MISHITTYIVFFLIKQLEFGRVLYLPGGGTFCEDIIYWARPNTYKGKFRFRGAGHPSAPLPDTLDLYHKLPIPLFSYSNIHPDMQKSNYLHFTPLLNPHKNPNVSIAYLVST